MSDEKYTDKVKNSVTESANDSIKAGKATYEKQQKVANNKNATSSQKNIATALAAAEGGLAAFGAITGAMDTISAAAMMPLLEKVSAFKGTAILPLTKQTDPVMGIDVHMVTIPPSPAPVPMPHPYIGMMFKAADFVAVALATLIPTPDQAQAVDEESSSEEVEAANTQNAKALGHQVATMVIGMIGATVKIGGFLPRVTASTPSKPIPHFPMGAGFHPVYSRMVAKDHGHSLLGSLFVVADGNPISGTVPHMHNDCWDIGVFTPHDVSNKVMGMKLFVPSGMVMPIPAGRPVLTNIIPSPLNPLNVFKSLFKAGFGKLKNLGKKKPCTRLSKKLHAMNDGRKNGGNKIVRKLIQTFVGHPIDVAGGFLFTDEEDFFLPGQIPLAFERIWYSSSEYQGPMGSGWHHSLDWGIKIDLDDQFANVRMGDGRAALFDAIPIESIDEPRFNRSEKLFLHKHADGFYFVQDSDGMLYNFSSKAYPDRENSHLLTSIASPNGFAIRLEYDPQGNLIQIIDSAHRVLECTNNKKGQLVKIATRNEKNTSEKLVLATYEYDDQDDLVKQTNANGDAMLFEYKNHLLHKETWRNGAVFHFRYDGTKIGAKCIETWGNGDLLHYTLEYKGNTTISTDSLGNVTTYIHENGIVIETIDPKGGIHKANFNAYDELEYEINAMEQVYGETHDEYGNVITSMEADGAMAKFEYYDVNNPFLLTEALDSSGGKWTWEYDAVGNLLQKKNPAGAITRFEYSDGLLSKIINHEKAETILEYDQYYNLSKITFPDGTREELQYDFFGNLITQVDAKKNEVTKVYDKLGRPVAVNLPDGNRQKIAYDALDNVIHYKDNNSEIEMRYNAMSKLRSRTQGKATLEFTYNTEGQLKSVINEKGEDYTFVYDQNGEVKEEKGFDKIVKNYERNILGWVTKQTKNKKHATQYEHDEAGRVTRVTYADGFIENFSYQNGQLAMATNPNSEVIFAYDVMGNVVQESCNGNTIESEYSILDSRLSLKSSMGANIEMEYNTMGDIVRHKATGWESKTTRDEFGLEIEKHLTGGIVSKWERDNIGRVKGHTIGAKKMTRVNRRYMWGTNDRLKEILDANMGTSKFDYDTWGNLSKASYSDGSTQHRNPDAVGNLYTTNDRSDRNYGKGGQLLKSKDWFFHYDDLGNLVLKTKRILLKTDTDTSWKGGDWHYTWLENGTLAAVQRPDGEMVTFTYDTLGRRLTKTYKKTTTNWLWDGNKPLHEWKTFQSKDAVTDDVITWVFDEDSFSPVAKLRADKKYSILSDYLGTPTHLFNDGGEVIWEAALDSYGKLRVEKGTLGSCPFRYQGQYEDFETGLYYNRFRYYSPEEGNYISQDPIELEGGFELYSYTHDPNTWLDILGLKGIIYLRTDPRTGKEYIGKSKSPEAFKRREAAHNAKRKKAMGKNYDNRKYRFDKLEENVSGKKKLQNREQTNIDKKGGIKNLENKINAKKKKKAGYKK
jgi:RHS repeat-associated protein